jgi:hypothetical protein
MAVAGGESINDLGDEHTRADDLAVAPREGIRPVLKVCTSQDAELEYVVHQIREIVDRQLVGYGDVAIAVTTNDEARRVKLALDAAGMPSQTLESYTGRPTNAVKVGTHFRIKGLEFKLVFLPVPEPWPLPPARNRGTGRDGVRRAAGARHLPAVRRDDSRSGRALCHVHCRSERGARARPGGVRAHLANSARTPCVTSESSNEGRFPARSETVMEVFKLRDQLIDDYQAYVTSFMALRDTRVKERVETSLKDGRLWPEPRIGLNPAFESGGAVDALVDEGLLHEGCRKVFRVGKSTADPLGRPMRLHRHQVDAIRQAQLGRNYVLTTGTGSGKSLSYIVPIVDHVLRNGSGKGVQAIVVYPMNALANSQEQELKKFLGFGFGTPPVRVERYTGQETLEKREEILHNPPDVILTNYVMLELILTRIKDQRLIRSAQGLKFLVLDELHTYRGRQGADVALLVRRVREACSATELQCVGTSATLSTEGTHLDQRRAVAQVASTLFGADVLPEAVIGETLRRATPAIDHLSLDPPIGVG